jgi:hypothetical protein
MSDMLDEATMDETPTDDETPTPLPAEVMGRSEELSHSEDDLPLHLRVVKAIVEAEPTQLNHALALANEIYELEMNAELED